MQEQPWNKASTSNKKENKRRHSFYCQKKGKRKKPAQPHDLLPPLKDVFRVFVILRAATPPAKRHRMCLCDQMGIKIKRSNKIGPFFF